MQTGRGARGIATAVVAALALGGCWPAPGQNADRTAHNAFEQRITPVTVADLAEAWTVDLGLTATDPVASAGRVHVVSSSCTLSTVDAATGAYRWSQPCDEYLGFARDASAPYVSGQIVSTGFWGSYDTPGPTPPEIFTVPRRYDIATGAEVGGSTPGALPAGGRGDHEIWTSPRSVYAQVPGAPYPVLTGTVSNGLLIVRPTDGSAGGRDIRTAGGGTPTLGTEIVVQTGPGTLAVEPGDPTTGQGVRAYARAEQGAGCGGGQGDLVECPLWVVPTDGVPTDAVLAPDQSTVFVGTDAGTVYAIDATDGAVRWTASVAGGVTSEPALADGTLYVPTGSGQVVAFPAEGCGAVNCTAQWSTSTGSAVRVQPAVAGGVVFAGSDDGSVDAFDATGCGAATCAPLWSAETGSGITGAPAVSNGRLYVGTADGRLVAYR